jgi:large subunit ribosomal protein L35
MPKMKTRKSASKRFTVTGGGKIKYKKMGMRKKLSKKSNRRKRVLNKAGILSPAEDQKVKRMLPYS